MRRTRNMAAPRGRGRGKGANALPMEEVRAAKARKREHAAAERAAADPLPHFMFPSEVLEEESLSTTAGLRRIVSHLGRARLRYRGKPTTRCLSSALMHSGKP